MLVITNIYNLIIFIVIFKLKCCVVLRVVKCSSGELKKKKGEMQAISFVKVKCSAVR